MSGHFTVVENHGNEHVWNYAPAYAQSVMAVQAEFIWKASQVLTEFHRAWTAEHKDDPWAQGLEIDLALVTSDGMLMGFMHLSEHDEHTYDYSPTEQVEPEKVRLVGTKQQEEKK